MSRGKHRAKTFKHYNFDRNKTLCGAVADEVNGTQDYGNVTCAKCVNIIRKPKVPANA